MKKHGTKKILSALALQIGFEPAREDGMGGGGALDYNSNTLTIGPSKLVTIYVDNWYIIYCVCIVWLTAITHDDDVSRYVIGL